MNLLYKPPTRYAVCKVCGVRFSKPWARSFCSKECKAANIRPLNRAWQKKYRALGLRDRGKHRKRARRYGVGYEPIRLLRVLERDGWVCGICQQPISPDAKYPSPWMPSLDHVIPMSKGGAHIYGNVQAAHHRCNTLKSNRTTDQRIVA